MNQNFLPTFTISDLHNFLIDTLNACIAQRNKEQQLFCVRGVLRNVEEELQKTKYPSVYGLIIQDRTGSIEVEIPKNLLSGFKNGSCVEIQGVPTFNFFKEQCTKRLKGYAVQAIEEDRDVQAFQTKLSTLDVLKKHRPKSHTFPNQFDLSIAVIYSSATKVNIQEDFYKLLDEYIDEFHFDEIPVSLSNVDALSHTINSCMDHDIVVIIRGGGNSDSFDIFNDEKILDAFSALGAYRIVGLGHNSDVTLLDFLADHSAFTPLDAGLHLKEQFDELFSRREILEQQRTQISKLQHDLKAKDSDVIGLSAQLKQLSNRTDIQMLMKENKSLVELNHELRQKMNAERQQGEASQKSNVLIFAIATVAIIVGMVLGRLV